MMDEDSVNGRIIRLEEQVKNLQAGYADMRTEALRERERIDKRISNGLADVRGAMVTKESVATVKTIGASLLLGTLMFVLSRILEGSF